MKIFKRNQGEALQAKCTRMYDHALQKSEIVITKFNGVNIVMLPEKKGIKFSIELKKDF